MIIAAIQNVEKFQESQPYFLEIKTLREGMDLKVDENSDRIRDIDEKIEPEELWEESWFFGNLLDRKSRMLRSFSDPCTSANYSQDEKSLEETYESIKKFSGCDEFTRFNLIKAPSMPTSLDRKHQNSETKESCDLRRSCQPNRKISSNNLLRAPSLPISLGIQEFQDEEIEFSMGKLIRQASMNNSDIIPPRTHAPKGVASSSSISRHQSRRKPDIESTKMEGLEEIGTQRLKNQLKTQKSLSMVQSKELNGSKELDLGFDYRKKESNPHIISTIPGLQEKKTMEEKNTMRPYLSEAWRVQSSAPPVPKWGTGKKSTEDMKAQIKFWARAVASNVH